MPLRLRKRFFAWMMHLGERANQKTYGAYKSPLFRGLQGHVLEIGPGTGINFNYLPSGIHWLGIEPNVSFHETILRKAKEKGIYARLLSGDAQQIPLPDNHVDAVFFTLLLCSVPDPDAALAEIKRVLKPGGKLLFIEHVAATRATRLRTLQDFVNPINQMMADGCHCNRETWKNIERAGFNSVQQEHVLVKSTLCFHSPHIIGCANK